MNKSRSSFPWPQFMIAFLIFIFVLVLGFIFQDALRESIDYILYIFWAGELAITSFDQRCIWLLALVIALVLTLKILHQNIENPTVEPKAPVWRSSPEINRIQFWRNRVKLRSNAVNERDFYLADLLHLVSKTLAYHHKSSLDEINQQLRSGDLIVPPEVQDILGLVETPIAQDQQVGIIQRVKQRFRWLQERFKAPTNLPNSKFEEIAAYLESLLEDDDDI